MGYLLIILGVAVIAFAAANVYLVFTKQADPISLFEFTGIELDLSQATQVNLPSELQEAGIEITNQPSQKQEILPAGMLNATSNLLAHIVLMGFVVNVGYKIATIGTELVRPIIVKVRPNKSSILVPRDKKSNT